MSSFKTIKPYLLRVQQNTLYILLTVGSPIFASAQTPYVSGSEVKQENPFLYEVEKNGKVSHILGSMHAGVPLSSYPVEIFQLSMNAENLAFESDVDAFFSENKDLILKAREYPEGESLDQFLSPNALQKLREILEVGENDQSFLKYKPWTIGAMIGQKMLAELRKESAPELWDNAHGIDSVLEKNSKLTGKKITYLDDMTKKIQEMTESTSASDIERVLAYPDPVKFMLKCARMAQGSYIMGNESGLKQYSETCETEKFLRQVDVRTKNWIPKLETLFANGNGFVVVGASHVYGPNGLAEILRTRGYQVRRVNLNENSAAGTNDNRSNERAYQSGGVR